MPAGLEVFDATGVPIVSITDRLPRVLGLQASGLAPGSIVISKNDNEVAWAAAIPTNSSRENNPVLLSVAGSTISWTWQFTTPTVSLMTADILYGVY